MTPSGTLGFRELPGHGPQTADILIVEDNPEVRSTLKRLVESYGHTVKTASSAEEADTWLASQRFHVCLLDIQLPKMTGVEFLAWAHGRDPELAVIMLTGLDDPELAKECLDKGARTYLVKPPDSDFLRLAIRDALAVRQLLVDRNGSAG